MEPILILGDGYSVIGSGKDSAAHEAQGEKNLDDKNAYASMLT